MNPVKAAPTGCNPFVHGKKPKITHSSIKPIKTQKTRWVGLLKKPGFFKTLPPLGDLGATYDDHLRLIGKRVVDFLLALIELR